MDRDLRKLEGKIDKSEKTIERLEQAIQEKSAMLSDPSKHPDLNFDTLSVEFNRLNQELESEMQNWEKLHEQVDELKSREE